MCVRVMYGDEPYLVEYYKKKISGLVKYPDINLNVFYSVDGGLMEKLYECPVLEDRRVVFLYLDDMKEITHSKEMSGYLENPVSSTELALFCRKADKRDRLFKSLLAEGKAFSCEKMDDLKKLQGIILTEVKRQGAEMTREAYHLLMERENYLERKDITLLDILSDVRRLAAYSPEITQETVALLIKENPSALMFKVAGMLKRGDLKGLRQQAEALSGKEIETLSALLREYRIAWKCKRFGEEAVGVRTPLLIGMPEDRLVAGMETITGVISSLKKGAIPSGNAMMYTWMCLLGQK